MPRQRIEWDEFDKLMHRLAQDIRITSQCPPVSPIKCLAPISRGGLIPATILSHILDLPIVDVLMINRSKQETTVTRVGAKLENCLFVDDIVDTGATVDILSAIYRPTFVAAPVGKVKGVNLVQRNLFVRPPKIVFDEVWIEFPWERKGE